MLRNINITIIAVFFLISMASMSFPQSMQINTSGITLNPNAGGLLKLDNNNNPNGDLILYPTSYRHGFIGTSTNLFRHLYVWTVHYGDLIGLSDSTEKENITDLENVFDKIKKIRTVRFDFKPMEIGNDSLDRKNKIGFIAQDVMKYFPEMVKKDGGNGKYSVNYMEMIPVLLKAVQDLKEIVDKQQKAIDALTGK